MWGVRRLTRIQINLGHGALPLIGCLNILVTHRVRVERLACRDPRPSSLVPIALEVTVRHPGRKKLDIVIAALNRNSYGCHEVEFD
jgi:hypothetical protein